MPDFEEDLAGIHGSSKGNSESSDLLQPASHDGTNSGDSFIDDDLSSS